MSAQVATLAESLRKCELEKSAVMSVESVKAEIKKKEMLLIAYQEDAASKKAIIEEMDRASTLNNIQISELQTKLHDIQKRVSELRDEGRFYPAAEIRQKAKALVNLRFIKNEKGEYVFEVSSLKDKRSYPVKGIEVFLHEARKDCIIVKVKGKVEKLEVYETEFATSVQQGYMECAATPEAK